MPFGASLFWRWGRNVLKLIETSVPYSSQVPMQLMLKKISSFIFFNNCLCYRRVWCVPHPWAESKLCPALLYIFLFQRINMRLLSALPLVGFKVLMLYQKKGNNSQSSSLVFNIVCSKHIKWHKNNMMNIFIWHHLYGKISFKNTFIFCL